MAAVATTRTRSAPSSRAWRTCRSTTPATSSTFSGARRLSRPSALPRRGYSRRGAALARGAPLPPPPPGALVDLPGRRAFVAPERFAEAGVLALGHELGDQPAVTALGHEQASGVRADVDARAAQLAIALSSDG